MKRAILSLAFALALTCATAQDKDKTVMDETTVSDMKSSVKFDTYSDGLFKMILAKHEAKLTRYMVTYKKDRNGPYKQYIFYVRPEDKEEVIQVIKSFKG